VVTKTAQFASKDRLTPIKLNALPMGNFYTNIAVMADADRVVPVLEQVRRDAYVAPSGSVCVVFDRESDRQDTETLAALAETISREVATHAFAVLNHDDDVLWFQLYERGELLTEHANEAGAPTASAWVLAKAFGRPARVLATWLVLRVPTLFEVFRHHLLMRVLGLPPASVGMGYEYINRGELPPGTEESALIRVGQRSG